MRDDSQWLTEDQQAVWQHLRTVVVGLPALLDRQLQRDAGLLNFEYSVLARLSMTPSRSMRLSELALECTVSQPRLSKVMNRFEQRGWVTRSTDPANARYTVATLTDEGLGKVVDSAPGHVAQVRRLVFDTLEPQQQEQLGVALQRVALVIRQQMDQR